MASKIKLTKSVVEKLPYAEKGKQIDYYDSDLHAFGIRVSATTKTYFVRKRINGKMTRVNLGSHRTITADEARKEASNAISDIRKGIDINREKARRRDRGITLQKAFDTYLADHASIKASTKSSDSSLLKVHLSTWLNTPIAEITSEMIRKRHSQLERGHSGVTANNVMRLFRRIYLYTARHVNDELDKELVKNALNGKWARSTRRKTFIKAHDLPLWHAATKKIESATIRDYLLLLLFTGLRKTEALTLSWDNVDMKGRTFTIPITKNGNPHTLPMSEYLYRLFEQRMKMRENHYVFPGKIADSHLIEPKRQMTYVTKETQRVINGFASMEELDKAIAKGKKNLSPGISFCLHDLRRTFATIAESLVSYAILKKLLNHADDDVTAGYLVISVDKLKIPMQQISDAIIEMIETEVRTHTSQGITLPES